MQRNVSAHGEDIRDTLSDLIPVVSAFASLIYDPIERDAGNNVLGERCGRIWEALKETPAMSEIMVIVLWVMDKILCRYSVDYSLRNMHCTNKLSKQFECNK